MAVSSELRVPIKRVSFHTRFYICILVEWGLPTKGWNEDGFATRKFPEMFWHLEWHWAYGNQKLNQVSLFQAIVSKKQREAGNAKHKQLIYFQYLTDPWLWLLGAAAIVVLMAEIVGKEYKKQIKAPNHSPNSFPGSKKGIKM